MSRFMLALARAAASRRDVFATFSISRSNELYEDFAPIGVPILPVDTFTSAPGALLRSYRIPGLRSKVLQFARSERIDIIVNVMPHVWSSFVSRGFGNEGIRYAVIVHDAERHPGDPTGFANRLLLRDAMRASRIVTLSRAVTDQLVGKGIDRTRISTLFLPDLNDIAGRAARRRVPGDPLRVLFFGRIAPYKGLPLLVAAVEQLAAAGTPLVLGVYGEGDLGALRPRLANLNATLRNRWIDDREISEIFQQYDLVLVSHEEASQSGVVALALGHGLPVVATPVGALTEQVIHGVNGLVADAVSAEAIAAQIARVACEPGLFDRLAENIVRQAPERSMARFLDRLIEALLPGPAGLATR